MFTDTNGVDDAVIAFVVVPIDVPTVERRQT